MKGKRAIILWLSTMFAFAMILNVNAQLQQTEKMPIYYRNYAGLILEIKSSPRQVYPSEKINITVRVEAYTEIYIDYIYINISAIKNQQDNIVLNTTCLEHFNLSYGKSLECTYEVTILEGTSPGQAYGEVSYHWAIEGDERHWVKLCSPMDSPVTYVKSKKLEELYEKYGSLNCTLQELRVNYTDLEKNYTELCEEYDSLNTNYTELESRIGELGNARRLMYVFAVTTVCFIFTTLYLVWKKPKQYY